MMRIQTYSILLSLIGANAVILDAKANPSDLEATAPRIVGGSTSQDCAWPSTVGVGNCTGTLIHPKLVVYAAHCGSKISEVVFGPSIVDPARRVATKKCEIYPGGGVMGNDVAYCELSEDITDIPVIPPAMGNDTDLLAKDRSVWAVGYGYYNQNREYGLKHEVELSVNGFMASDHKILLAGGNGKDACQGDSGGPLFLELPEGRGFRLVGITSFGFEGEKDSQALPCGFGGGWAVLHHHIPWLETQSGLDITPCHDAQGNPDPDERCGAAPIAPAKTSGEWPDDCNFGKQLPALANLPPAIRWTESVSTSPREIGAAFDVELLVRDEDGIDQVGLLVNGTPQDPVTSKPFRWSIEIPDADNLELEAYAVDLEGHKSHAKKLTLPLKVRTGGDTPNTPGSSGNPADPGLPPPSTDGEAPSGSVPPSQIESSRSCSLGGDAPYGLAFGLLALLLRPRRRD